MTGQIAGYLRSSSRNNDSWNISFSTDTAKKINKNYDLAQFLSLELKLLKYINVFSYQL